MHAITGSAGWSFDRFVTSLAIAGCCSLVSWYRWQRQDRAVKLDAIIAWRTCRDTLKSVTATETTADVERLSQLTSKVAAVVVRMMRFN